MLKPFDKKLDIYCCDCGVTFEEWRIDKNDEIEIYDGVNNEWVSNCPNCMLTTSYNCIKDNENSWDEEDN